MIGQHTRAGLLHAHRMRVVPSDVTPVSSTTNVSPFLQLPALPDFSSISFRHGGALRQTCNGSSICTRRGSRGRKISLPPRI